VVAVACLNIGSSSVKYARYSFAGTEVVEHHRGSTTDVDGALDAIAGASGADAIGHRIVHGGMHHDRPAVVDDALLGELGQLIPFAPLHLPAEIDAVAAARGRFPDIPHVACFDTAFHRHLPEISQRLPLPRSLFDEGIRRYGFHGLSYEYVSEVMDAGHRGRVIIAHLGNGASMVALRNGVPLHTTMGFTPAGGLVMGTRTGDLDPGVLVYLARRGEEASGLDRLVNHESGLRGLSGTTADMEQLLATRDRDPAAAEAVAAFVRSAAMHVGALTVVLSGLDALVFTGGIGEHAPAVRDEIVAQLGHLGVGTTAAVMVVPTDEELMIARHTLRVLTRQDGLDDTDRI
jgi:acetate kinase